MISGILEPIHSIHNYLCYVIIYIDLYFLKGASPHLSLIKNFEAL